MKLVEINWNPTSRQLRQFGIACLCALPLVGWLWGGNPQIVALLGLTGAALAAIGLMRPTALKPVFLALTIVATPIGIVIGELVMILIYFGVFLPIGLLFKLTRRDALQLKLDRTSSSYWQSKKRPSSKRPSHQIDSQ